LSTLHTNDAAGAISRLINLGVQPFQVASAMLGVVAQRLVRTICPKCKAVHEPTEEEFEALFGDGSNAGGDVVTNARQKEDAEKLNAVKETYRKSTLYKGAGCESCRKTGYRGRQGVYEILEINSILRNMIVEGASDDQLKACAIMQGMKTLKMRSAQQVMEGSTTLDELIRVVDMRED
jgi:type IV pilus assembly protein PilB